jgi:hypothetical protein
VKEIFDELFHPTQALFWRKCQHLADLREVYRRQPIGDHFEDLSSRGWFSQDPAILQRQAATCLTADPLSLNYAASGRP